MERLHLFEWEDLGWFPSTIRDLMTDYLRHVVVLFGMYRPVVPVLEQALADAECDTVVDLASGGGGPWAAVAPALHRAHPNLKVVLTDRYPNVPALEALKRAAPEVVEVRTDPVDALHVPAGLAGLRTLFLSLHHFRPAQVKAIFQDAIASGQPIAVFEFQERTIAQAIQFALSPIFVLLLSPAIRPFSVKRLFFTYLVPLVPLFIMWDGVVSVLRTYTAAEVRGIVQSIPESDSYEWDVRSEKEGHLTVFRAVGRPRSIVRSPAPVRDPGSGGGRGLEQR